MKINELLNSFEIYTTNEEAALLKKMEQVLPIEFYNEREQVVIENLIRKSLVSKIKRNDSYMVIRNEQSNTC